MDDLVVDERPMAVILAAGRGRRLGAGHSGPKALLEFAGRTLLDRHLAALQAHGVDAVSLTVGYQAGLLRSVLGRRGTTVENPDYSAGSLVSLWAQREALRAGRPIILMDADVLCDSRMIGALLSAPGEAVLLVDRELEPGDEPVKACVRGDVLVDFRKQPTEAHEWHGESVGFFKFSARISAALADACDAYMAAGASHLEYEEAIRDILLKRPADFGFVDVTHLPWTEIDFPEDIDRARSVILPSLAD